MAGWRDAAVAGVLGVAVGAAAVMTFGHHPAGQDKAAIGRIVHDYVLDHPEILPEAMHRLEARQTAKLVAEHRSAIERPYGGAWAGAANGDVTLVEFTDFACGYCRASLSDVGRLLAEDPKLKVVYREYPILTAESGTAARVALAASSPGRYGQFRRSIYAAGPPSAESIAAAAASAEIDPTKGNSPAIGEEIGNNVALARTLGIGGTPAFVIGDQLLSGAVGYDALKAAIAQAREKNG
jgi:protein-disulfide isomerase